MKDSDTEYIQAVDITDAVGHNCIYELIGGFCSSICVLAQIQPAFKIKHYHKIKHAISS